MKVLLCRIWLAIRSSAGRRWVHWGSTAIWVVALGAVLLPVTRRQPESVHSHFASAAPWQRIGVTFLACALAAWLLVSLFQPKLNHLLRWRVALKHPPLWSAWVLAAILLCALDLVFGLGPPTFEPTVGAWAGYGCGAVLFVLLLTWLMAKPVPEVEPAEQGVDDHAANSLEQLVAEWRALERWLTVESPTSVDLIGHQRVARRLAEYVVASGGSIGLIGPFGSGKSSILARLKREVKRITEATPGTHTIWFAEQSCWGFEDSSAAIQQVLNRTVQEVGKEVDCFTLRSLPEAYRKTFSAGGDWLRTLADMVFGSPEPMEQFRHLSDVLRRAHARLVVVIEDLDRTTSSRFDRQEVMALLQRLKELDGFSFILATGRESAREIDFAKLCDHIEILQDIRPALAAELIKAVRDHCLRAFHDIPITSPEHNPWNMAESLLFRRHDTLALADAATRLLRTPRALKHALRRAYSGWQRLHGEIDFDHLLAVSILRHGAPEAFDFLIRHWDRLQDDPQTWQSAREQLPAMVARLTAEWGRVTGGVEWEVRAAMALLCYLLPPAGQYLGAQRDRQGGTLQGVHQHRYWHRVFNEELEPHEVLDQAVLRDIEDWRRTRSETSALLEGLLSGVDYARVWEHFARQTFAGENRRVLVLAEQLLSRMRGLPPCTDPPPAFVALWRFAIRAVPRDDGSREWLREQLRLAAGSSLTLVNDLFYYWGASDNGIVRREDRIELRGQVLDLARENLRNGEDVLCRTHVGDPYSVYQLVFPPGDDEPIPHRGLPDWGWLGPILLDALRSDPTKMAGEVGSLISDRSGAGNRFPGESVIDRALLAGFFGESAGEVIRLLSRGRDGATGNARVFLDQILRSPVAEEHTRAAVTGGER